jgi:hypothetical protein
MDFVLGINQIGKLITVNGGDKTYFVEGPMGSGKTEGIMKYAQEKFRDAYNYVTVDCTQWDVGDFQLPDADKVNEVMRFLPNALLVGDGSKPMFINFDEVGKSSRPVLNCILPVALERRVGIKPLPVVGDLRSIVCATTNLGAEGVGDVIPAHARNRVSFLEMRYPTNKEWIQWAMEHGVAPAMLKWADDNPQLFQSFKDVPNPSDNPWIFHPKEQRRAFFTPRSAYLASIELREDRRLAVDDDEATYAAIAGNIGARAALDLMAFVMLEKKAPRYAQIINDPDNAKVADSEAAMCMTAFSCVQKVQAHEMDAVMTYVLRLPREIQCLFATQVMRTKGKQMMACNNRQFSKWTAENSWLMVN